MKESPEALNERSVRKVIRFRFFVKIFPVRPDTNFYKLL